MRHRLLRCTSPEVCWFLDAGNDETLRTLSEPASKKRQGTKSREVGHRLSNERYEDCMSAPLSMVSATRARGDVMSAYRGTEESAVGISAGRVKCSNGRLVN